MEFLRACAAKLDGGAHADAVRATLEERYTTLGTLSVKMSLVRSLCTPEPAYVAALDALCALHPHHATALRASRYSRDPEVRALQATLPPRLAANARALCLTRAQQRLCKRAAAASVLRKNRECLRVDGAALLAETRRVLAAPESVPLAHLAFALMLASGRRTCEVLNGRARFAVAGPHVLEFAGLAKQRHESDAVLLLPTPVPAPHVVAALAQLRARQRGGALTNLQTSRRYQSLLSREMAAHALWRQCTRVHALRAIYVQIALRLFVWEESDAYVAMRLLGHSGIHDSLVYTAVHIGALDVAPLGRGPGRADDAHAAPPNDVATPCASETA